MWRLSRNIAPERVSKFQDSAIPCAILRVRGPSQTVVPKTKNYNVNLDSMRDRLLVVGKGALRGRLRRTWSRARRSDQQPPTRRSEYWLMARAVGRQCTTSSHAIANHHCDVCEIKTIKTLLLEDDPVTKQRILSAIRMTPTVVECVSTLAAALSFLDVTSFDIILIDRHFGGWVGAHTCKDLVDRACGKPVVGLIDEDCVLELRDGINAGLTAVYYKDEMNFRLMRRLARLGPPPSDGGVPLRAHLLRVES
jgi:hypothetical protein